MDYLDNLNNTIQVQGAYIGVLVDHASTVYITSIGEFIIAVLEIQYFAQAVANLISEYLQRASEIPSYTVPFHYTTYIDYIQDVLRRCKQALSRPIDNPQLMLLTPQKMLERAQQTMYNLLPNVPYEYTWAEQHFAVPIEHYSPCNNSLYSNDYTNLAIYARKAADDMERIPNVLIKVNEQRGIEDAAREYARITAQQAQTDVLAVITEQYAAEQSRIASNPNNQLQSIEELRGHANLNNIFRNPFGEHELRALHPQPQTLSRVDNAVFDRESDLYYVDPNFHKSVPDKIAILEKLIGRMNGRISLSEATYTPGQRDDRINFTEVLNKIVPVLGTKIDNALKQTLTLVRNRENEEVLKRHAEILQDLIGNDLFDNQELLSIKNIYEDAKDIYYQFPMSTLYTASKLIKESPITPMGGHNMRPRKQNFTKKRSKKHNITKHRKKI